MLAWPSSGQCGRGRVRLRSSAAAAGGCCCLARMQAAMGDSIPVEWSNNGAPARSLSGFSPSTLFSTLRSRPSACSAPRPFGAGGYLCALFSVSLLAVHFICPGCSSPTAQPAVRAAQRRPSCSRCRAQAVNLCGAPKVYLPRNTPPSLPSLPADPSRHAIARIVRLLNTLPIRARAHTACCDERSSLRLLSLDPPSLILAAIDYPNRNPPISPA